MSDDDRDWRAPDAKRMTFDEMAARAQYEWDRAEKAEAEAANYSARIEALEAENARLRADASARANENTNLRNDLVLAGTARDAAESALAEAVEVIDHLSSFSISDELGRTGKVADLCKAWVEHKKAARRFIASQEPAEQEK